MRMVNPPYFERDLKNTNLKIYIVSGKYIRENKDIDFTNFGQHSDFDFIPKDEMWLDIESVPNERQFFIDNMLATNYALARGVPLEEAKSYGIQIEKRERQKQLLRVEGQEIHSAHQLLKLVQIKLIRTVGLLSVYLVDGNKVRSMADITFTEGGHDLVYPWVPYLHVWIDDDLIESEREAVILHEVSERNCMARGLDYSTSHWIASQLELRYRRNEHTGRNADSEIS